MQGNPTAIALLNKAINSEQIAISILWLQSHVAREQGFDKLADKLKKISREKHHHVHQFTDRVLMLEGAVDLGNVVTPVMGPGVAVETMITDDLKMFETAVTEYTDAVNATMQIDPVTSQLFLCYLREEEEFAEWFEKQVDKIALLGLALYLQSKV